MSISGNDVTNIEYWKYRRITYTVHAMRQSTDRCIELMKSLPRDIRLADVDISDTGVVSLFIKVCPDLGEKPFFIWLAINGQIITVFRKDEEYHKWVERKHRFRELKGTGVI